MMNLMKHRSAFGWLDLFRGIVFLVLGIAALCFPNAALSGFVILYGIIAILSGIIDIVLYTKIKKYTGFEATVSLITGIFGILAGVLLLLNPVIGRWILNILFPIWFIIHCSSRIAEFGLMRRIAGNILSILLLCLNILGLFFGVFMLFNSALFTVSFSALIAVNLIILGIVSIIESFSDFGTPDTNWHIQSS